MRNTPFIVLFVMLAACGADVQNDTETVSQAVECAKTESDFIRLKLAPNCAGCHGQGTSAPYFASAESFEGLIVQNPRFIVPGDPDSSEFVRLLEGNGTGAFTQMPTAGVPYSQLPADQQGITVQEVRQWITGLSVGSRDTTPWRDAPTTRRLGADEFRDSLMTSLGLTYDDDFFQSYSSNFESQTVVLRGPLALRATDDAPGLHYVDQRTSVARRWAALGGADWLNRKPRTYDVSPSFLQTVTQVSQAWCELAVNKADNTALFRDVSPTQTSDVAAAEIKANIAYLHLRFLAMPASSDEVDAIFDNVFVAHESAGPQTGWVAVCSYFVRHPLALSL